MPLYQYRCRACDFVFEERRAFSDLERPAACPDCPSEDTRREITAPQVFSLGNALSPGSPEARGLSPQSTYACAYRGGAKSKGSS